MLASLSPLQICLFLILLFIASFFYSSVGHGGASGYLAVLALFSIDPSFMKSSALILNIFVSCIAFSQYYRAGYFKWKLFFPFALGSVPAAFAGALIPIQDVLYKKILAIALLFPVLRLFGLFGKPSEEQKSANSIASFIIGAFIGLLSGMIGIGGGIILSPILLLFHWANMKETAAVSSLFILVNSISGLLGLLSGGIKLDSSIYYLLLTVLIGGSLGAYLGSSKLNHLWLRYFLGLVLLVAAFKLFLV